MPESPTAADTIRHAGADMGRAADNAAACFANVALKPQVVALLADALVELADSCCESAHLCRRCTSVLALARGVLGEAPGAAVESRTEQHAAGAVDRG